MMTNSVDRLIYLICIVTCLAAGILLLYVKISPYPQARQYQKSRRYLAAAFFVIAGGKMMTLCFGGIGRPMSDCFSFLHLLAFSLLATLFTFALIALFYTPFITRRRIHRILWPIAILSLLYLGCIVCYGDLPLYSNMEFFEHLASPAVFIRALLLALNLYLLFYYTGLFIRALHHHRLHIKNYYADAGHHQLPRVELLYYTSLCIGVTVLFCQQYSNKIFNLVLILLSTLFCLVFAFYYINHPFVFQDIQTADTPQKNKPGAMADLKTAWEKEFAREPFYLKPELNIFDLAERLQVSPETLSQYICQTYGIRFCDWVNRKRIDEACLLMQKYPERPLARIAESCGYTDPHTFRSQFKRIIGKSPSSWQREQNTTL